MKVIKTSDLGFAREFEAILMRGSLDLDNATKIVSEILREIKESGESAILAHIARFDGWNPKNFDDIKFSQTELESAYNNLDKTLKTALKTAFSRITAFHEKQREKSWISFEENGTMLGAKISPLARAGLYIPGGKAAYPSSLLMNAIPAIVAGVGEIAVCSPTPKNEPSALLCAAMHICGIKEAYKVGGASAVGLLAYGVKNAVKKVDVITGPGNIFVACAKKLVFGEVQIDMVAGPSEIGIIADESANPAYLALDLLSQAEHDEMASAILITHSEKLANAVRSEVSRVLQTLKRRDITEKSIKNRSAIIISRSVGESLALMEQIAPEHLVFQII